MQSTPVPASSRYLQARMFAAPTDIGTTPRHLSRALDGMKRLHHQSHQHLRQAPHANNQQRHALHGTPQATKAGPTALSTAAPHWAVTASTWPRPAMSSSDSKGRRLTIDDFSASAVGLALEFIFQVGFKATWTATTASSTCSGCPAS